MHTWAQLRERALRIAASLRGLGYDFYDWGAGAARLAPQMQGRALRAVMAGGLIVVAAWLAWETRT